MPRKNSRPAAKKRQAKLRAKMERRAEFDRKARPIIRQPRTGDAVLLAAMAAGILSAGED